MPAQSLASPGSGVNPREDIAGGKTYFDFSPVTIVPAVGPVNVLAGDCGKVFTNAGGAGAASARALTLPSIPATGSLWFHFHDESGLGIEVIAQGTNFIRMGPGPSNITVTGGNIQSQMIGQGVTLRNISNKEWRADANPESWLIN